MPPTPPVPRDVAAFRRRLAAAATAEARLAAAYDYLRSRLSKLADPAAADQIRTDLAEQLAETAEGLR